MAGEFSEDEIQDLYAWVDTVPLSRPKRNIARDFSDGVLMAETVFSSSCSCRRVLCIPCQYSEKGVQGPACVGAFLGNTNAKITVSPSLMKRVSIAAPEIKGSGRQCIGRDGDGGSVLVNRTLLTGLVSWCWAAR